MRLVCINFQETSLRKKDLESQYGELLISDKKGAIIATADYNVSIENDKPIIHKIENFEFDKINAEGLNIGVIYNDLEENSEQRLGNKTADEAIFIHQKGEISEDIDISL